MLKKLNLAVQAIFFPLLGASLYEWIERHYQLPEPPKFDRSETKAEIADQTNRRNAAFQQLPWLARELHGVGRWAAAIELNLSDVFNLNFWPTYFKYPHIAFNLLWAALFIFLFGRLWGVVYKTRLERWLGLIA
jgi:hypothetical protein